MMIRNEIDFFSVIIILLIGIRKNKRTDKKFNFYPEFY